MTSKLSAFGKLVPEFEIALKTFLDSGSKFRVLKTIHPAHQGAQSPLRPPHHESPKTLFILDSSFNPPSIAHKTLAQSALSKSSVDKHAKPHRLLLLFAVMNADKAPSPASFEQRLSMMTVFAQDLVSCQDSSEAVPIDIGVTTKPYYTDKSLAIEDEGSEWYPSGPKHIHLIGYDTLVRFFAAKYYKDFDPPFSALNPFFDSGHQLRATLRPDDSFGSIEDQKNFHRRLEDGEMEKDGGRRTWAKQVELVPPNPKVGVSSTKIRKAAKDGDWETVEQLCTLGVAEWVKSKALYRDDET